MFGEITDGSRFHGADVAVLVFHVADQGSFAFARSKYAPLLKQYWGTRPFIVVGTNAEKTAQPISRFDQQPVPREVGVAFATEIGALAYFEYSKDTGLNAQPVLDTIALAPQPRWILKFAASYLRSGLPLKHSDAKTEAIFEVWNLLMRGPEWSNAAPSRSAPLSSSPRGGNGGIIPSSEHALSAPESNSPLSSSPPSPRGGALAVDGSRFVAEVDMNQLHFRDDIPEFFSKLVHTKVLRLGKNGLSEQNITPIVEMVGLTALDLSGNVLKTLPVALSKLKSLTSLDLSDNELDYLPRELPLNCTQLKHFDISENSLRALPFSLGLLADNLKSFEAKSNPLDSLPTDKGKRRPAAILSYLKKFQSGQPRSWRRVRTFIVGQEGVGKTTLLKQLLKHNTVVLKEQHNLSEPNMELSYRSTTESNPGDKATPPEPSSGGIDMQTFEMRLAVKGSSAKRKVEFRVFDLAGQESFYPQHQFFLGPGAVYVAVFSLAERDFGRLEYWLRTIRLVGRTETSLKPSVIIVGTHLDAIEKNPDITDPTGYLQTTSARIIKKFSNTVTVRSIIYVSNKNKKGIDELRTALQERAEKEMSLRDGTPPAVVALDRLLTSLRAERKYLTWVEYASLATQFDVLDDQQLVNVTQHLAEAGTVVWFNQTNLRELVFLDLVWLSQILAVVVRPSPSAQQQLPQSPQPSGSNQRSRTPTRRTTSVAASSTSITLASSPGTTGSPTPKKRVEFTIDRSRSSSIEDLMDRGELPHDRLHELWRDYPPHLHRTLLQLLHHFEVAFPLKGTDKSLVPSLLPPSRPLEFITERKKRFDDNNENLLKLERLYRFRFVPLGFFPRVIVRALHIPQTVLVSGWQNAVIIRLGTQTGLLEWHANDHKLSVLVVQPTNRDLLFPHLLQQIDSLIKTFYQSAKVDRFVISHQVSALQQSTYKYEEVLNAFQQGAKTFYCGQIPVPLEDLAPDICLNYIPELKDVSVDRKLGAGGFGVVFRGMYDGKVVAIKELHVKSAPSGSTEESIDRFRAFVHEVWIMSKLNHPNLVRLYGITQHPLRMVMEYCPGLDLYSYLRRGSRAGDREMPADQLRKFQLRIAIDIARGMSYLHGLRPPIVHRDLRSPNVFIMSTDPNGEVVAKIGDFGLSEAASHQFNDFLSTWAWLAPETFNPGETVKYTEKCDLYSFGIVLYEIYSGQDPFGEYFADPRFVQSIERQLLTQEDLDNQEQLKKWRSLGWTIRPEDNMLLERSWNVHRIKDAIIREGLRPSIPPTVPKAIREIMLACWQGDPDSRPPFTQLLRMLMVEADREGLRVGPSPTAAAPLVPPTSLEAEGDDAEDPEDSAVAPAAQLALSWQPSAERKKNRRAPIVNRRFNSKIGVDTGIMSMVAVPSSSEIWCGCRDGSIRVFNYQHSQKGMLFTLLGHGSRVSSLVATPSHVWSAGDDSKICIWDASQHRMVNILGAHAVPVRSLIYIPEAEEVWSGDVDGVINMWSSKSHLLLASLTVPKTGVVIPSSSTKPVAPTAVVPDVSLPISVSAPVPSHAFDRFSSSTPSAISILSASVVPTTGRYLGNGQKPDWQEAPVAGGGASAATQTPAPQPAPVNPASLPPTPVLSMCLVDLRPEDGRASLSVSGTTIGVRRRAASTAVRSQRIVATGNLEQDELQFGMGDEVPAQEASGEADDASDSEKDTDIGDDESRPTVSSMLEVWVGCNSRMVVVSVATRSISASWEAHVGYRITSIQTVGQHVWTGADIRICIWDKHSKKQLIGEGGHPLERQVEYGVVCMLACRRPNNKYHIWTGSANGSIIVWSSNINKKDKVIFQVLNGHKKDSVHSLVDCGRGTVCSGSYGNPTDKNRDNSLCVWCYQ
jgi:serine/threonine protein kinase/GTPase SAR1 family protein